MLNGNGHSGMREPFVGEIREFSGDVPPPGWALCDGQILQINEHRTLFALLGSQFGGDGRWTFALPSLSGARGSGAVNKVARNQRENDATASHEAGVTSGSGRGVRFIISLLGEAAEEAP